MTREYSAISPSARAEMGSVRCQAMSSTPAVDHISTPGVINPPVGKMPGNGPKPTPTAAMSSRPSHHSGIE